MTYLPKAKKPALDLYLVRETNIFLKVALTCCKDKDQGGEEFMVAYELPSWDWVKVGDGVSSSRLREVEEVVGGEAWSVRMIAFAGVL